MAKKTLSRKAAKPPVPKNRSWMVGLFPALLAFLLYANTIPNFYSLDDELVTRDHRYTSKGLSGIPEILEKPYYSDNAGNFYGYRPTVHISFALEHQFFGESPHTGHFINALLYGLTVFLLFLTLTRLFRGGNIWMPLLASLLFAVHPLHTEVVASLKNRDELLALLFVLAALYGISWLKPRLSFGSFLLVNVPLVLLVVLSLFVAAFAKAGVIPFVLLIPLSVFMFREFDLKNLLLMSSAIAIVPLFALPPFPGIRVAGAALVIVILLLSAPVFKGDVYKPLTRRIGRLAKWFGGGIQSAGRNFSNRFQAGKKQLRHASGNLINKVSRTWKEREEEGALSVLSLPAMLVLSAIILVTGIAAYAFYSLPVIPGIALFLLGVIGVFSRNRARSVHTLIFALIGTLVFHELGTKLWYPLVLLPLFFEVSWNRAQDRKLLGGGFLLILIYLFISGFYQEISLFFGLMAAFTLMIRSDKRGLHVAGLVLLIVLGLIPLWTLVMEGVGSYQMYYLQLVPILLLFFARVSPRWYRAAMSLLMLGGVMAILIPSLDSLAFRGRGMRTESREVIPNQVENDSTNGLPDPEGTKEIVTGKGDSVSINPPSRRVMDFSENPLVREKAWGSKIGTGFYILGNYFRLLIFPHPLRYYYGYDQIPVVGPANPLVILSMLLYAGLIFIAFYFLRRDPPLSFGLLAYLASIAFYSNMYLPVAGMLGERLAYTASLGFCIAMAAGLIRLFRVPENTVLANWKKMNPVFLGVVALLLFAGAARTVVRNTYWKDSLTLYQHDLPRLSRSAKAHNLLAMSLVLEAKDLPDGVQKEKLLAQSASLFTKCSQIYDAFPFVWFDLGRVNLMLGRKEEALEAFRRSTQVDFHYASAWFYTGYLLDQKGVLGEAARNYQEAIKVDPQFLDPYTMLSYVYFKQGKMEESIQVNLSALKAMPSAYDPMVNLGKTYTHIGDKGNAAIWLEKAYQIKGSDRELLSILSKLFEGMGDESKAGFYKERLRSLDN